MATIRFFCAGKPAPGGSKTAFQNKRTGRIVLVDAGRNNKGWRNDVATACRKVFQGRPLDGALAITVTFIMPRPKHHFRTNGQLKDSAPQHHLIKPDSTKLMRALEDALTKIAYTDDCIIPVQHVFKRWANVGETAGADVEITELEGVGLCP